MASASPGSPAPDPTSITFWPAGIAEWITAQLSTATTNYAAPATRVDQMGLSEAQKGTLISGLTHSSAEIAKRQSSEMHTEVPTTQMPVPIWGIM